MSAIPLDRLRGLPPLWLESRYSFELAALWRDPVFMGAGMPRGRGEPVLLIPGYLAGDPSLATLTFWLRRLGYRTSRAGIRLNVDCGGSTLVRLEQRLDGLAQRYGRRVAIVGQSRGGAFARALAARRPDLVSGIVTLGSPLRDPLAVHPLVRLNVRAVAMLGRLGLPRLISYDCADGECCAHLRAAWHAEWPEDVGFLSVYSRSDGIVDWRACLDDGATHHEIDSSHCGMSVHPDAYRAIGSTLPRFREREDARGSAASARAA